ncbi:MAG: thioredoxin family protein [Bacteroidales bacterium]|nr:thioredoxin family protein [Bacteroidales bacterium]
MKIIVLGTGCSKCKNLEKVVREAVDKTGINASVTKEEDIMKIMEYGVMSTPALVIDDEVVVKGTVPSVKEISKLITK